MSGSIGVTSELGKGSVFTVILPLRRGAEVEAEPAAAAQTVPASALADCRLLVIEANPLAQSVLRSALTPKVRDLEIAAGPDEALQALKLGVFDHVLADGAALGAAEEDRLPQLTAVAASAAVSVMWPLPDEALKARLLQAGAAQVLVKPITPADVAAALAAWFLSAEQSERNAVQSGVTAC